MNEYENENVRPPDAVKRECLLPTSLARGFIPYTEQEEDDHYRRVLEESEHEYMMEQILAESVLEEGRRRAREERKRKFATLKAKFAQFKRLDKDNQEFYTTILAYIESYESGDLIQAQVGVEFYRKFRLTLNNIRVSPEDKRRILGFIVPNNDDEWSDSSHSDTGI